MTLNVCQTRTTPQYYLKSCHNLSIKGFLTLEEHCERLCTGIDFKKYIGLHIDIILMLGERHIPVLTSKIYQTSKHGTAIPLASS